MMAPGEWEAMAIHGITDAMVKGRCIDAARLQVRAATAHRALGDAETTVNLILGAEPAGNTHLLHLISRKMGPRE